RRAFRDAASPLPGPVFVSIPMDILDQDDDAPVPPRSSVDRAAVAGGLDQLAARLTSGGRLALVAGEEVGSSPGGVDAFVAVAERLGAPVFGSPLHSVTVFPPTHPLWAGGLAPRADAIRAQLSGYDTVFLVGSH